MALVIENLAANAGDMGSIPGSGRCPWRRTWQPTPVFLPGEFHGQRSLAGYGPQGYKESDKTEAIQQAHMVLAKRREDFRSCKPYQKLLKIRKEFPTVS